MDNATPPSAYQPDLLIITGMSGAGRTRAASVLEDHDWFVVDNLPPQMLIPLARLVVQVAGEMRQLAVVVDVRGREFFDQLVEVLERLDSSGTAYRMLFLDASDEALVRRFEQVRRPHPLQDGRTILDGIAEERQRLEFLRSQADVVIDTSNLNVHELASEIGDAFLSARTNALRLVVMSFGFKYGLPLDADHVVDVRFLANPYWVPELRHLTGLAPEVSEYVLASEGAAVFLERYVEVMEPVLSGYLKERKRFATIAIGCTGGKHRSVALAEAIGGRLAAQGHDLRIAHRDLGKE